MLRSGRWAVFRRAMALACLIVFVSAAAVHTYQEAAEPIVVSASVAIASSFGDDATGASAPHATHCHGCAGVAMLELPALPLTEDAASRLVSTPIVAPLRTAHRTDTPPPKFSA